MPGFLNAVKWTARILSLLCISIILLFILGEKAALPSFPEIIGLLFFPIGVLAGLIVAFRHSMAGGLISVFSLLFFYIWHYLRAASFPGGAAFIIFTSPAIIFLIYAYLELRWKRHNS